MTVTSTSAVRDATPRHEFRKGLPTRCIFHAYGKNPQEFCDNLARLIRKWQTIEWQRRLNSGDFSGFIFPAGIKNSDLTPESNENNKLLFPVHVYYNNAQFIGDVSFREAKFNGDANFSKANFNGAVNFREVEYNGGCGFQ